MIKFEKKYVSECDDDIGTSFVLWSKVYKGVMLDNGLQQLFCNASGLTAQLSLYSTWFYQ